MNTLIENRLFVKYESEEVLDDSFSYNGCCKQTIEQENNGGQLVYKLGHAGAGVASRTRYGDGTFIVYGVIDEDGRTKQLIVDFGDEEDKDDIIKQLDEKSPMDELKKTLHKAVNYLEKDKSKASQKLREELLEKMLQIL
jgi:hypothetical protein